MEVIWTILWVFSIFGLAFGPIHNTKYFYTLFTVAVISLTALII